MIHCKQTEPQNQRRHITYMQSGRLQGTRAHAPAEATRHTHTHIFRPASLILRRIQLPLKDLSDVLSSNSTACAPRTERWCVSGRADIKPCTENTHTQNQTEGDNLEGPPLHTCHSSHVSRVRKSVRLDCRGGADGRMNRQSSPRGGRRRDLQGRGLWEPSSLPFFWLLLKPSMTKTELMGWLVSADGWQMERRKTKALCFGIPRNHFHTAAPFFSTDLYVVLNE